MLDDSELDVEADETDEADWLDDVLVDDDSDDSDETDDNVRDELEPDDSDDVDGMIASVPLVKSVCLNICESQDSSQTRHD